METKTYNGLELSRLGMGNMRLPTKSNGDIDFDRAKAIIDYGMTNGINYYDTAYVYHSGKSEEFVGDALVSCYPRESFCVATKFLIGADPDYKAVFERQLEHLKTDYVDFYLIHAVTDDTYRKYIESGCVEYFAEQKKQGRIKNLGFSTHSSPKVLREFAYYHDWDFAQMQLNYFDWLFGSAKEEYEILSERKLPIIVMEPVRGGRLATLSPETEQILKKAHPDWSIASWAMRWIKRLPQVQTVLSGMSNNEQIADNINTFSDGSALTDEEEKLLFEACRIFRDKVRVPCTACRYCCDGCPAQINIPVVLEIYNRSKTDGDWILGELDRADTKGRAVDCIGCKSCEEHCPQGIKISEIMSEIAERQS